VSCLRVLTYNVRGLRDDTAALARVVRAVDPDVVCVQEAPRLLRWRSRCAALARQCGLLYVAGGRTTGGTALLASLRVDVGTVAEIRLSHPPVTDRIASRGRRWHQRGLTVARFTAGGHAVDVASVHLGLDAEQRRVHAQEVLRHLGRRGGTYAVLAGDLNEVPGATAWRLLADRFVDATDASSAQAPTFSARDPRRRIDAVLVDRELSVVRAGVPTDLVSTADLEIASDHRPVLAVLRLSAGRP
jgi:endonuclease/exonuclease/phosphatase family metal-dependent hydrolase